MNDDLCYAMPDQRTRWQKFICWLLPAKYAMLPPQDEIPFPLGNGDVIHIDTFTTFTMWERVKILLFGCVATTIRVITEEKPGQHRTVLETYVSTESREKRLLGG